MFQIDKLFQNYKLLLYGHIQSYMFVYSWQDLELKFISCIII